MLRVLVFSAYVLLFLGVTLSPQALLAQCSPDTEPPVLVCNASILVQLPDPVPGGGHEVPQSQINAMAVISESDNCTANPNGPFTIGGRNARTFNASQIGNPVSLTLTINDGNGNSTTCTVSVDVQGSSQNDGCSPDTEAPTFTCNPSITIELPATVPPGGYEVSQAEINSLAVVSMSDNCTTNLNGPFTVGGNGARTFDASQVGTPVALTLTVDDGNGNNANCTVNVDVQDNNTPGGNEPTNGNVTTDAAGTSRAIYLNTQSDGSAVRLRWAIDHPDDWQWANDHGYTISRMTRRVNGQTLTLGQQAQSRVVLVNSFKPLAPGAWGNDELSQSARSILDASQWQATATDPFAAAAETATNAENRLFFAHVLAERDYHLAVGLGLGYTDATVEADKEYVYTITVNQRSVNNRALNAGAMGGLGQGANQLAPVTDLLVQSGDTAVRVGWSTERVKYLYTSYDIYRAPAGSTTFEKANAIPFMPGFTGEGEDPEFAMFSDSVATYGEYNYYVVGRTPFGLFGPPSDTVAASSRPARLALIMLVDSVVATETSVALHWPRVSGEHDGKMVAQRVYRAADIKANYEVVSPPGLPVTARSWQDNDPIPSGYYIVELEDENGHYYRSQPQSGQLIDETPPATPIGFSGSDSGDGSLTLTWNANTEADLKGYQLFRCYARGGQFASVEVDLLTDTSYTDNLRGTIVNDSIYYRLLAKDQRGNASPQTPVLVVARVDITPPGKPTLARVSPTPAGIAFNWEYSADEDVVRHELQRRLKGGPNWETILTIDAANEGDYVIDNFDAAGSINYLDETDLPRADYDYQLLAFDEMNLGAGSEIVTVRPHDSGERGEIRDLAISAACADSTVVTDLDAAYRSALTNFLDSYETDGSYTEQELKGVFQALEMSGLATTTQFAQWQTLPAAQLYDQIKAIYEANAPETKLSNCAIELQWSYPLDPTLQHFQVYRSRQGSRLRPYRALPVAHFYPGAVPTGRQLLTFTDDNALVGVRYVYKVMAVHLDGGYSKEGSGVTVVVE